MSITATSGIARASDQIPCTGTTPPRADRAPDASADRSGCGSDARSANTLPFFLASQPHDPDV
ncbi:hypothetical protein AXE65_12565 [Ventosimonas gracilis]|uniref:Uncharacterized protein n=1 Tax=Ventosimonas gracilis TaxID=1680762 RepID=A0A139SW87_9GAMM|nr:hypothetical protein AXE65_12565 [Ventosimonas gracilis]